MSELEDEIAAGVEFWGYEDDGELAGVMGIQDVGDVEPDQARVRPARPPGPRELQRADGKRLTLRRDAASPGRHLGGRRSGRSASTSGTASSPGRAPERSAELLRAHWDIPERQIETSIVLAQTGH